MKSIHYINFNGSLKNADDAVFKVKNRLRYGDGFFESMRVFNGKIVFKDKHENRIAFSLQALKMDLNNFSLEKEVEKVLQANQIAFGRVRIQFYRAGEGLYTPLQTQCEYVIEADNDDVQTFSLQQAKMVGISKKHFKSKHFLGNIKSSNALLNVMCAIEIKEQNWSDAILLNDAGDICETLSANIFLINKSDVIFTPNLASACVSGVMRSVVIDLLKDNDYELVEKKLSVNDLMQAKEVFFTNATRGITHVQQIEDRIYTTQELSSHLVEWLNKQRELLNKG